MLPSPALRRRPLPRAVQHAAAAAMRQWEPRYWEDCGGKPRFPIAALRPPHRFTHWLADVSLPIDVSWTGSKGAQRTQAPGVDAYAVDAEWQAHITRAASPPLSIPTSSVAHRGGDVRRRRD